MYANRVFITITIWFLVQIFVTCGRDVLPQKELYCPDYEKYHNLTNLYSELLNIGTKYPAVNISWKYKLNGVYSQPFLKYVINSGNDVANNVKILITSGEHAREFFPVEYVLFLLKRMSESLYIERNIFSRVTLFVLPMMNPSGRAFLEKTGKLIVIIIMVNLQCCTFLDRNKLLQNYFIIFKLNQK